MAAGGGVTREVNRLAAAPAIVSGAAVPEPGQRITYGPFNAQFITAVGTDHKIRYLEQTSGDGDFSPWLVLDNVTTSNPSVVYDPGFGICLFWRGITGAIWTRTLLDASHTWTAATSLGGLTPSEPVAQTTTTGGTSRTDVYVRGNNNRLYHKSMKNGVWSASWGDSLGGELKSKPAVFSDRLWTNGRQYVFAQFTDNTVRYRVAQYDPVTSYGPWISLGGHVTAVPSVVSNVDGLLTVVVRGTDSALWTKHQTSPTTWSRWQGLGGVATSGAAISRGNNGFAVVVVRGTNRLLYAKSQLSATTWSAYSNMGSFPTVGGAT